MKYCFPVGVCGKLGWHAGVLPNTPAMAHSPVNLVSTWSLCSAPSSGVLFNSPQHKSAVRVTIVGSVCVCLLP